jgi:hypothetical protein
MDFRVWSLESSSMRVTFIGLWALARCSMRFGTQTLNLSQPVIERRFSLFMLSLAKENEYYQVFLPQAIGLGIAFGLMFLPSSAFL